MRIQTGDGLIGRETILDLSLSSRLGEERFYTFRFSSNEQVGLFHIQLLRIGRNFFSQIGSRIIKPHLTMITAWSFFKGKHENKECCPEQDFLEHYLDIFICKYYKYCKISISKLLEENRPRPPPKGENMKVHFNKNFGNLTFRYGTKESSMSFMLDFDLGKYQFALLTGDTFIAYHEGRILSIWRDL